MNDSLLICEVGNAIALIVRKLWNLFGVKSSRCWPVDPHASPPYSNSLHTAICDVFEGDDVADVTLEAVGWILTCISEYFLEGNEINNTNRKSFPNIVRTSG